MSKIDILRFDDCLALVYKGGFSTFCLLNYLVSGGLSFSLKGKLKVCHCIN